jgi:hypothetical protein
VLNYSLEDAPAHTGNRASPDSPLRLISSHAARRLPMDVVICIPFAEEFGPVYETIKRAAARAGLTADRVDKRHGAANGTALPVRIQEAISECRLLIADLTAENINVGHEVGYAMGKGKPLILICGRSPADLSADFRNLGMHEYRQDELGELEEYLYDEFRSLFSANATLREMLVPSTLDADSPFIVAASPLAYRRATNTAGGYRTLRRTYSDHVGVRGILRSFGMIYGPDRLPEILDPEDFRDDVVDEPMNVYCIASPKANVWTGHFLGRYAQEWRPTVRFHADPISEDLRNLKVSLWINRGIYAPDGFSPDDDSAESRWYHDFGIIVRGPKPGHPKNMMAILAGRTALGTEAACMAFTSANHVAVIRERLQGLGRRLDDHTEPFLAVVSVKRSHESPHEAILESLEVGEVRVLKTLSTK